MADQSEFLARLREAHEQGDLEAQVADANTLLLEARMQEAGIQASVLDGWADALDRFELLVRTCRALGAEFAVTHWDAAREADDDLFLALVHLWAGGCLAGAEILTLLRAGFGGGAFGRCRTLHELCVIAQYLVEHDPDIATRYWFHHSLRQPKSRWAYQHSASGDPEDRYSSRQMYEFKDYLRRLREEHGAEFVDSDYGWAHDMLMRENERYASAHAAGNRKRGPSLADLAEGIEDNDGRLLSFVASEVIHGVPGAINIAIGAGGNRDPIVGPDPDSLYLAGTSSVDPICLVTMAFLSAFPEHGELDPTYSWVPEFLGKLGNLTVGAFNESDEKFGRQ
jgi:hypothetical protein